MYNVDVHAQTTCMQGVVTAIHGRAVLTPTTGGFDPPLRTL